MVVPFFFPCGFIFSLVLFSVSLDTFQVSPKGEKSILGYVGELVLDDGHLDTIAPREVGFAPGVTQVHRVV